MAARTLAEITADLRERESARVALEKELNGQLANATKTVARHECSMFSAGAGHIGVEIGEATFDSEDFAHIVGWFLKHHGTALNEPGATDDAEGGK